MIRRMIFHGIVAALLVGALAFGWQAFGAGDGLAGASNAVLGRLVAGDRRGHGRDDG